MNSYFVTVVEINNLTTNPVDENLVKNVAKTVLEGENKSGADLSIAFVGQGRMRKLNKKYLGKNRTTDVLAFPEPKLFPKKLPSSLQKTQNLGEIVISLRDVKKNVKRFQSSMEKELTQVLTHGILHLLGYDHEKSEKEAKRMFEKQEFYLRQLELKYG